MVGVVIYTDVTVLQQAAKSNSKDTPDVRCDGPTSAARVTGQQLDEGVHVFNFKFNIHGQQHRSVGSTSDG